MAENGASDVWAKLLRHMKLAIARPIDLADVQMIDELTALLEAKSRPAGK